MVAEAVNSLALVFPGQGSQAVGMGRAWAERSEAAAATFAEADKTLGFALSELCWNGPEEELRLTAVAQPAIVTVSIAILRALADRRLEPSLVAGHSLGEYSALVAAGALSFPDALRLVRLRGQLMQEAVPVGVGAMAAILGPEADEVAAAAADAAGDQVCTVANYNAPGQTVIAGHREAVERAVELARERGARRAVLLPVSAPFHCPLMKPAREGLAPALAQTAFVDARTPVVTNVDARPVTAGAEAREALERQVDHPVRWVDSVRTMVDRGVSRFVEVGPGSVLTGLIRRIERGAETVSLSEPVGLERLEPTW